MADRQRSANAARLAVKVSAGASQTAITGWSGDCLRVRIGVPAERGKANAALVALIADRLGLPKSAIRVAAGKTSVRKTLEIAGLSQSAIVARIGGRNGK